MRRRSNQRRNRRGNVLVLTAVLMVFMMGLLAFAVDLGYLYVTRTELQRSSDAAALAAAWQLLEEEGTISRYEFSGPSELVDAQAREYATANRVAGKGSDLAASDIIVGRLDTPTSPLEEMRFDDPTLFNVVRVRVRKTADQNGQVPLFFAKVWGLEGSSLEAQSTAMFLNNFDGFTTPSNGETLDILPFALDKTTWDTFLAGGGTDNWKWNAEQGTIQAGSDGIKEMNLYPQGTGSPGNRGTVDIGSSNNSTADIARQILHGVSPQDLEHHGGELKFNDQGVLPLNGDTGISAGVKDELAAIRGQPRIIPVFSRVSAPGNNATYTIVKFVGVRIMDVKLTGSMSSKRVIIQPACVRTYGGIPATGEVKSYGIYSPVHLIR